MQLRQKDGDQNGNADGDCQDNKIGLRERLFRWMSRSANSPDNEHDDVQQGNAQDDECENPISYRDWSVFGVAHNTIISLFCSNRVLPEQCKREPWWPLRQAGNLRARQSGLRDRGGRIYQN